MPPIDNPILSNIIPYISKEERSDLFNIVDKQLQGNYIEKAKALEVKQSAYYQYQKKCLFCWDDVPGSGNKGLKKFLKNIDWVKKARIDKVDDDKTIKVSKSIKGSTNFILLTINDEKSKVNVKFSDSKTEELVVKKEDGKLNIYRKNLEISDSKTLLLLKLLHGKDLKKFNEFLDPITARVKYQITIVNDCLNSRLFELDFNLPGKLFDIYQKYDTFSKDSEQKQNELDKQRKKKLLEQSGLPKNVRLDLYDALFDELAKDPRSWGEVFADCDSQTWRSDYYFWKNIAKQIHFEDKVNKFSSAKIPNSTWWENLFAHLYERYDEGTLFDETNSEISDAHLFIERYDSISVKERDFQEKLKEYRETLREEFNKEGHNLNEEQFKSLLVHCDSLFDTKVPLFQVKSNQIENSSVMSIVNLLKPPAPKPALMKLMEA